MEEKVTIVVADLIGSTLCITAEDGQIIYEKIVAYLKKNAGNIALTKANGYMISYGWK